MRSSPRSKAAAGAAVLSILCFLAGLLADRASAAVPTGPELATAVLARIEVAPEHRGGYQRSLFEHWVDLTGDGCNGREKVLRDESVDRPQIDPYGCKVIAGRWRSAYDGFESEDPTDFDVDHVVALKEAWDSGAWNWTPERRKAFANDTSDPRTLRAVSSSSNRAKSDKDPSNWVPPARPLLCTYLADWIAIKARWGLSMDPSEVGFIRKQLRARCATTTIAPWPPITLPVADGTVATTARTAATTRPAATAGTTAATAGLTTGTVPATGTAGAIVFANCAAARAVGAAPLRRGDPGYSTKLDRDGDGIACE